MLWNVLINFRSAGQGKVLKCTDFTKEHCFNILHQILQGQVAVSVCCPSVILGWKHPGPLSASNVSAGPCGHQLVQGASWAVSGSSENPGPRTLGTHPPPWAPSRKMCFRSTDVTLHDCPEAPHWTLGPICSWVGDNRELSRHLRVMTRSSLVSRGP